eukprot:6216931-Amphidinium_carterae.2
MAVACMKALPLHHCCFFLQSPLRCAVDTCSWYPYETVTDRSVTAIGKPCDGGDRSNEAHPGIEGGVSHGDAPAAA